MQRSRAVLLCLALAACAQAPRESAEPPRSLAEEIAAFSRLPATFRNTPSCAGCLEVTLTLLPDGTYTVRENLGASEFHDFGRWRLSREGTVSLRGGRDATRRYTLRPPDTLDSLEGTRGGDLARQPAVETLRGPFRLVGFYDGRSFRECLTRATWPVADSRAAEALRRELLGLGVGSALVAVDGRFQDAGAGTELLLVRQASVLSGTRCPE